MQSQNIFRMKLERLFRLAILFVCLVNRHSSLKPPDQEHKQLSSREESPKIEEAIIDKDFSEVNEVNVQESVVSETPALQVAPSLSTEGASATGQLSEQEVAPTVAPATPNYDLEPTMPALYSVVHDASRGDSLEEVSDEASVQLSEPLKSSVDSSPPVPVSNEPPPNPDPADISGSKFEEDSITSVLRQAEEENKPKEDEMPSFDEFKRQMLKEEEEKIKQQNTQDAAGTQTKPKVKKPKKRKQTNYASVDCGAKVLSVNPEASNAEAILTENRDIYMLNPCSAKIFFVVELCDTAHVKSIDIANFELFSSMPESFRVYVSNRYPTREWTMLGTFQATEQRDVQSFPLDEAIYAKYLKVEMLSHFGSEHYCPLSLLRVYGISMMEELEDQETDTQEDGEVTDGDTDDDVIQVLPPDPSAKEDELKDKGILEKAADTVISFVKKFVSSDGTKNGSSDNTSVKAQQSIVTLIERDDGEENVTDVKKTTSSSSASDELALGGKNDSKSLQPHTPAPSPCEVFVEHLRHPSFGCFNGRIFYCKKYQNLTITAEPLQGKIEASSGIERKVPIVRKLDVNDDEDKQGIRQERPEESKSLKELLKRKKSTSKRLRLHKRIKTAQLQSAVKKRRAAVQRSEQRVEQSSASAATTTSVKMAASVASAAQPSMPRKPSTQELSSSVQEQSTPSVPSPVTSVTTKPQPADSLVVSVLPAISTVSDEGTAVEPVEENTPELSRTGEKKPVIDKKAIPLVEKYPESERSESESSPSSITSRIEVISESQDAAVVIEVSASDSVQSSVHSAEKKVDEESVVSPTTTVQSECTAVNSIELVNKNSPHVDVLEIKLTDGSGKEGTAELQQPDDSDSSIEGKQEELQTEIAAASVAPEQHHESSSSEQQEKTEDKKTDNKQADPATASPASSEVLSASSESDSVLELEPPRQAPPVVSQELDMPRLPSVCSPDLAASSEASADLSSKAVQQASASLGLGMGSGQKESIFMRLNNKIKALEQNLTLSTLYMEQINQRYRKNLDELLKTFEKKTALLSNATIKAEVVINGQKEQISQLQEQLSKTSAVVSELKQKMASLNEEVMERHIIGLVLEVILILALMIMFRRCERQRALRGPAPPIQNGTGPPRLLHDHHPLAEKHKGEARAQPDPEIIRAASLPLPPTGAEDRTKDSIGESKKKKHKRRSKCLEPALAPAVSTDASPQTPPSMMTYTAGLLFSSARGILDSLIVKKPTGCQSEPNISSAFNTKRAGLVRARSLNGVPEQVSDKAPPPPPPPPPRPPQNGWAKKVPTPPLPTCSENRRHSASHGVHSPKKTGFLFSGKYGKQVKVG